MLDFIADQLVGTLVMMRTLEALDRAGVDLANREEDWRPTVSDAALGYAARYHASQPEAMAHAIAENLLAGLEGGEG